MNIAINCRKKKCRHSFLIIKATLSVNFHYGSSGLITESAECIPRDEKMGVNEYYIVDVGKNYIDVEQMSCGCD
jgi:hypothetical protein